MIECKTYAFRTEFCKELGIALNQVDRRRDELLAWLSNFFEYELIDSRPLQISITEIYGEYQPLPRKVPTQDELTKAK